MADPQMEVVQDGVTRRTSSSFFRGKDTNFWPTPRSRMQDDSLSTYLMHGWAPEAPMITRQTPIVSFGSCFAQNVSDYLARRGFNVLSRDNDAYVTQMGDGMVNTFAIRQQFEWAWLGKTPQGALWHGYSAQEFGYKESVRRETKRLFDAADVFIITLGLSEIWYDEPTGEVFWRAVPLERYDAARHKFRVATVEENRDNLLAIHALIRRFRPDAVMVVTLSPIPLAATFRPVSCVTANAVSKAVLRAALDQFLAAVPDLNAKTFYFPSYEVVTALFQNQWQDDGRHVRLTILNLNMKIFERFFCETDITDAELLKAYRTCRGEDRANAPLQPVPEGAEGAAETNELRRKLLSVSDKNERIALRMQELAQEHRVVLARQRAKHRRRNWIMSTLFGVAGLAGGVALMALVGLMLAD